MKKLLPILILIVTLFTCSGVCAKESNYYEIGPKFTEEILKCQTIPYEMKGFSIPQYYAISDPMTAFIEENVLDVNTGEIDITPFIKGNATFQEIADLCESSLYEIISESPHVFYMDSYMPRTYPNGKITLQIVYTHTREEILKMISETNKKVDEVYNKIIKSGMTPLQKELAAHDYIVANCAYDMENYENRTVPDISHSAYGALCLNTAVCDGYSRALKLFLDKFDIPNIIVTSNEMSHAWNMINLDGNNYHVDATWNDTDKKRYSRYNYFNIDDAAFSDHIWVKSDYPACTDTKFAYIYSLESGMYPRTDNVFFYYRDKTNDNLIKMNVNTGEKQVLVDKRSLFIALHNNVLFFSDYAYGGHLYSVSTSGANLTVCDTGLINNLYIENGSLHYTHEVQDVITEKSIALSAPIPIAFNVNDLYIEYGYFTNASSLPIFKIESNKTVSAKICFQNKRANATANIFAVAFDEDNVISDIEAETFPLLPGTNYNIDLALDTEGAKCAKLFIMYGFEPMAKPVIIEK